MPIINQSRLFGPRTFPPRQPHHSKIGPGSKVQLEELLKLLNLPVQVTVDALLIRFATLVQDGAIENVGSTFRSEDVKQVFAAQVDLNMVWLMLGTIAEEEGTEEFKNNVIPGWATMGEMAILRLYQLVTGLRAYYKKKYTVKENENGGDAGRHAGGVGTGRRSLTTRGANAVRPVGDQTQQDRQREQHQYWEQRLAQLQQQLAEVWQLEQDAVQWDQLLDQEHDELLQARQQQEQLHQRLTQLENQARQQRQQQKQPDHQQDQLQEELAQLRKMLEQSDAKLVQSEESMRAGKQERAAWAEAIRRFRTTIEAKICLVQEQLREMN